ncbi:IQ domain-containing protein D [Papilio xuthus]|uniref:Dynein regulatory complex protein 10 n=1 Tax=Papilio xuthus TaxID=66420 RepID=A0A194PQU5_PAPXU|nr:IQ domain-containing protein D [Papilio xuthus]
MESHSAGTLLSPSTFSESSKTGSSKSADSTTKDKDQDFTKDNAASPIDLECKIQAERITKILDESINKTKLAICLPGLVKEYRTLNSILSNQHMDDLLLIFDQYDSPLFSTSLLNMGAFEDLKAGDVSLKNRLNPELGLLLYIMNSYPALKPVVEEMIDEGKPETPGLKYLLALENFRGLMVKQMEMTAAEELSMKLKTRKLEASNIKLTKKIEEHTKTLKEESENFEETMKHKAEVIASLEAELATQNRETAVKLQKKVLDSERQMVLATRAHLVKNEMLKEEEAESREVYENLLKVHLLEEKNLRARRLKVETQLLSWLQKYDVEMADKQVELDEFTEKYEEEMRKCKELEDQIAEQDKEYIPLMAEREAEYHEEMTQKMQKFLQEHAARVIQNAWREVLANRAEKKKLKKLLKKMQAAEEKKGGKK